MIFQSKIFTAKEALRTSVVKVAAKNSRASLKLSPVAATGTQTLRTGTQKIGTSTVGGTKKITAIEVFSKEKAFRPKQTGSKPAPKILARVQELRLLSKLEQAGLLSLLEKNGLTLSAIEKSGLLSTAEKLGLISAAADRNTPGALYTLATALLAAGPALVYFVPDDNTALVVAQVLGALACVVGGSAAYGGATLLSALQK